MRMRKRTVVGSTIVLLAGMTAWAQGPGSNVLESGLERQLDRDPARDARLAQSGLYDVANQVFLLEIQEKSLRAQLTEAESKVNDLRSQIQKTEQEITQARSLGVHNKLIILRRKNP